MKNIMKSAAVAVLVTATVYQNVNLASARRSSEHWQQAAERYEAAAFRSQAMAVKYQASARASSAQPRQLAAGN